MKRHLVFPLAILAAFTMSSSMLAQTFTLYVNPTTGNDSWKGTISAPSGGNGPLRTPAGVQNAISNHGPCNGPIIVNFEAGTYYLTSTWTMPASQTCATSSITYQSWSGNAQGTYPVISGGVNVGGSGWQHATNANGTIFWKTLPSQFNSTNLPFTPEALYYNNVRRFRTRFGASNATYSGGVPNLTNLAPASFPGPTAPEPNGRIPSTSPNYDQFAYTSGDWPDTVATAANSNYNGWNPNNQTGSPCKNPGEPTYGGDIEVLVFELWTLSRERIACIDSSATPPVVYLLGSTAPNTNHGYMKGHRYIIENFVTRDTNGRPILYQGQFFIDRNTSPYTLYYEQITGEPAPGQSTVVVPYLATPNTTNCQTTSCGALLAATGIQNVTISGLTFVNDNYFPPTGGYPAIQSDASLGMAVSCMDCSNVTWTGNTFTQTIGHALELQTDGKEASADNFINSNYFFDLGGDAVMYGNIPHSTNTTYTMTGGQIESNLVQGYGRMYPGSSGIEHPQGAVTIIKYNDVNDGYQTGIGVCIPSTTTCDQAGASDITIDLNHVWNIGKGVTDDMGAIYVATILAPTISVSNNRLHDINDAQLNDTDGYGGNGLYLDQNTGDVEVRNNLVYRANFHAGQNTNGPLLSSNSNTWQNNVLAYSRVAMFYDGTPSPLTQPLPATYLVNTLTNNVFLFDGNGTWASSTPPEQSNKATSFSLQAACTVLASNNTAQTWNHNVYYNTAASSWGTTSGAFYTIKPSATSCGGASNENPLTFATWQSPQGQDGSSSLIPNTTTHMFVQPYCTLSTVAACEKTSGQDNYSIATGYSFPTGTFSFANFSATLSAGRQSQTFPSCPISTPYACTVPDTFPTLTFSPTNSPAVY
jgi:hypothetical protein